MKRTVGIMLLVLVLLGGGCIATGLAQNTLIRWSAVDAGFGTLMLNGTKLAAVLGQSFTGPAQAGGTRVQSGFLAGVLFRGDVTGVGGSKVAALPTAVVLSQNYPNPFNPTTTIRYGLPGRSHVVLTVFNILGQRVVELVNADVDAGYHEVLFNAGNLASGVYFYRMSVVPVGPRDLVPGMTRDGQASGVQGSSARGGSGAGSFVETRRLNLVK